MDPNIVVEAGDAFLVLFEQLEGVSVSKKDSKGGPYKYCNPRM